MEGDERKRFVVSILFLAAVLFSVAEQGPRIPASVDGGKVLSLVEELAAAEYEGRMIGSPGGRRAAERLAGILRKAGYEIRFQEFPERPGYNRGDAGLEIFLPGGGREVFEYRRDFRETPRGGWTGGGVEGPLFLLENRRGEFPGGSVLLVPASAYNPADLGTFADRGAAGVILELPEGSPAQRTGYTGAAPGALVEAKRGMIVLAVSPDAYARLVEACGKKARVRMASPVRFEDARGRNVIAAWNGDGGAFMPEFALMAHYDHVGTDADGSHFPGALDNASGAALAVRIAEAVARRSPTVDFALVLTDGEEVNLGGSWALAAGQPFPLKGVRVINLDMVGSRSDMALTVFHNGDPGSRELAAAILAMLNEAGFRAFERAPVYNLDHAHLPRAGARAVSICEYDTSVYHTKGDLPGLLSESELTLLGEALLRLVLQELESR